MDSRVSSLLHTLGGVYRDPSRVDRDATALVRSSAGVHLKPNIGDLVENNGDVTTVLVMQGTIAMTFKSSTYQILVDIYLPPMYPRRPPVCFVRLAENMYLKENHVHVGRDGQVYLPYLHEWRANTHNLVELVVAMSSVFSTDPPVFTRATTPKQKQEPPPSYNDSVSVTQSELQQQAEALLVHEVAQANRAAEAARAAAAQEAELAKQRAAQQEWDAKKLVDVKNRVTTKLQKQLKLFSLETTSNMQTDYQDKIALQHHKEKLETSMEELQKSKSELEQQLALVGSATVDIQQWLEESSNNDASEQKQRHVDDLVQPKRIEGKQMLELSALNASLVDALYFLDKALVKGTVDCTTHQKYVRKLAKRQFMTRAHLVKISQVVKERSFVEY